MTLKANLVFKFPETMLSCCYELTARALSLNNEYLMQSTSEGQLFQLLKQKTNKLTHSSFDAIANTWEAHENK